MFIDKLATESNIYIVFDICFIVQFVTIAPYRVNINFIALDIVNYDLVEL